MKFAARFAPGGKVYQFAAIRADHYRGDRRWFITQNNEYPPSDPMPNSPCTWIELVRFAEPSTVVRAPAIAHWNPISNLPALSNVQSRED